ncbi:MAG TPA: VIT1/CCC1 transporter family protein [Candidatus Binataceae bacterium]|nr:VIT1/CCC1 transporter family protein [Candidatus Binataceae bacterium]
MASQTGKRKLEHHLQHPEDERTVDSGGMRDVMLGLNDGLVASFAVTSGVAAAFAAPRIAVMAGMAEMLGGAISMAAAAFISSRSQVEIYESEIAREHDEITRWPEHERDEVRAIYRKKGFSGPLLDEIVAHITADPERWRDVMMREELGLHHEHLDVPHRSAVRVGLSYLLGAAIPVIPYTLLGSPRAVTVSASVTILALFIVGAAKTLVTSRSWWRSGLESLAVGVAAAIVTFGAGWMFRTR